MSSATTWHNNVPRTVTHESLVALKNFPGLFFFLVPDGGRNVPKARPRVPRLPKTQESRRDRQKRPQCAPDATFGKCCFWAVFGPGGPPGEEEEEEEFFNHYKNDLKRHAHTPSGDAPSRRRRRRRRRSSLTGGRGAAGAFKTLNPKP